MLYLRPESSLLDFQNYVRQLEIERGFDDERLVHKCLFLSEELGEFFELIEQPAMHGLIAGELADLLIFPCAIANRLSIDFDAALAQEKGIAAGTPLTQVQQLLGTQTSSLASLGLQLGTAIGKLSKVIRKLENLKIGTHSKEVKAQAALVETVMALCAVANRAGVNMEKAFRDKEEINKTRTWIVSNPTAAQV
jgi:NTP pyrophosphatase (non-canonical NTP hydrolase)